MYHSRRIVVKNNNCENSEKAKRSDNIQSNSQKFLLVVAVNFLTGLCGGYCAKRFCRLEADVKGITSSYAAHSHVYDKSNNVRAIFHVRGGMYIIDGIMGDKFS